MTLFHFECPECQFDDAEARALASDALRNCPMCLSDSGHVVALRKWPATETTMTDAPEPHVYLCQLLCGPARHAIMAAAGAFPSQEAAARELEPTLCEAITRAVTIQANNPWCALCRSPMEAWIYETRRTPYRTMDEAQPHLEEQQRQQALTNFLFARHNR